ncbi:MAG: ribokinase [Planctomycetota bacterium]|nr:ribokinase [Planctomycetota bacterium]
MPRILVVGSVNMDIVAQVDRVPAPGENVRGTDLRTIPGGKGANQAVACARLGADTTFLGRVGDDAFGERLRQGLAAAGVRTDALRTVAGCASGIALILVDAAGQNTIVVTAGANGRLTPGDVEAARPLLEAADAVVLQLEIPPETVARTIHLARQVGRPTILDAGPPRASADAAVWECDVLSPNEAEAAALLGRPPGQDTPEAMARELAARGPKAVVIKAGSQGAVVAQGRRLVRVPAFKIRPVDTTAAGDAFTAALALEFVKGTDLVEAARVANAAGALACLRLGAQPSMPTAAEVTEFLARNG